jgi:DNA helicase-2/ATP-dependent DNA helicase PcrA
MTRQSRRASSVREPALLEQIPVWGRASETQSPAEVASSGVEALLEGLNPEQRRAVCHGEGPLLVIAGAGTGKTQMITRRIAWLIATRRARPSEILALTFTDKAAQEMQARVDQLVPYGYTDATVSTFHAFGDRLVREFALELGLPTDTRVLARPEVVIFLRERLFAMALDEYRPLGDPTRFLAALASLFSRCKDEDVSPQAFLEFAASLAGQATAAQADGLDHDRSAALAQRARRDGELAGAYARYQELLGEAGLIDFGDQVSLALRLLRESPATRLELQGRYRYVLVDEFQDTNRAQSQLVELLAAPHGNITVVGDDDQSIYKFRGAAISNILEFRRSHPRSRQIVLRRNYRSRAPILDASHRLIHFNDPDRLEVRNGIDKRLVAVRKGKEAPVRHLPFASGSEEADWIAREIATRIASGARARDFAILVRANADADPVLRSLNLCGVPWRFSGTSGLYARPEIRLLLAFLRTIADLSSSVDLYALAASDVYGLGGPDLTLLVNTARRRNRSLWEVID